MRTFVCVFLALRLTVAGASAWSPVCEYTCARMHAFIHVAVLSACACVSVGECAKGCVRVCMCVYVRVFECV